jgi:protease I
VRRALEQAGFTVKVASTVRGELLPDFKGGSNATADLALTEVDPADFDALIFGGGGGVWVFDKLDTPRENARRLVRAMLDANKPVAALCTGPVVLAKLGVLRDVPATAFTSKAEIRAALLAGGAQLRDDLPVVEQGNIITGRDPQAADDFTQTLIRRLRQKRN